MKAEHLFLVNFRTLQNTDEIILLTLNYISNQIYLSSYEVVDQLMIKVLDECITNRY